MARRQYSNTAAPLSLTVAATTSSTTLTVSSTTGYPTAPFTLGLERGTANEEVVLCTALSATTFTVTRGYNGTSGKAHAIGASVEHTVAAIDYDEANLHVNATLTSDDPHPQYVTAAEGTASYATAGHTHTFTKTTRLPHTWAISGEIKVPSGDTDYILPFFVPIPSGQTVTVRGARYRINSGTSATVTLQKRTSGTATAISTGLSVTTTETSTTGLTTTLADNDRLEIVVTAVSATPTHMTFCVFLDYAV